LQLIKGFVGIASNVPDGGYWDSDKDKSPKGSTNLYILNK
jgi:hypothetical protein